MPVRWQVENFQAMAFSILIFTRQQAPSRLFAQEKPLLANIADATEK
jgi:hypothetical protein